MFFLDNELYESVLICRRDTDTHSVENCMHSCMRACVLVCAHKSYRSFTLIRCSADANVERDMQHNNYYCSDTGDVKNM